MEKSTQNAESPVDSPSIAGPIILPSSCCSIIISTKKYKACFGLTSSISNALGIAPIYGPNTGIIFVTPTITLTSIVYGSFSMLMAAKHIRPIIAESTILPDIKPLNILLEILT